MPVPDDGVSEAAADVAETSAALVAPGAVDTALVEGVVAPLAPDEDAETDTEPEPDADEVVAAEADLVETAVAATVVDPCVIVNTNQ